MHEFHKQLARRVSEEIPMRAGAGRAARVRSAQNIRRRLAPLLQGRRTFGHHDWLVIGEFPDDKAAASAVLAAAAGGSLSEIETTVAMTAKDAHATFQSAGKAAKGFRSAGRSQ